MDLQILMLDGPLDVSVVRSLASEKKVWEPDALACGAAYVRDKLSAGDVYFDQDMWMLIGGRDALSRFRSVPPIGRALAFAGDKGFTVISGGEDRKALAHDEYLEDSTGLDWYIARMGGWPQQRGSGVTVAVIDSGLDSRHERHPRNTPDLDFQSLRTPPSTVAYDGRHHGTRCAGLIAGATIGTDRIAVAPDCRLVVCQHSTTVDPSFVSSVEFVLLASWAIRERGARIISFSYGASRQGLEQFADPRVLSRFARRLRNRNRALIFCAAGNSLVDKGESMLFPARCPGMVAVGGYRLQEHPALEGDNSCRGIVANLELSGFARWPAANPDFLLGPSVDLRTTDVTENGSMGKLHYMNKSSAACAFVAGIAALYMERYPRFTVDQVLLKMQSEAERVPDARCRGWEWRGARFPR